MRLLGLVLILGLSGCLASAHEQLTYDAHGIQIGIQHDPSTKANTPSALNSHPARLTPGEVHTLLRMLQVSGYSGIVAGLLVSPKPIPVFTDEELNLIVLPVTTALSRADPQERVFFSLPNLRAPYERDRTAGALFLRSPYLHVILTDHSTFTRTDTAGGEDDRDLRETKGMKLFIASPGRSAAPPPGQMPHWEPFEKVHVSLHVQEALAARAAPPSLPSAQTRPARPPETAAAPDPADELRLQLRELTQANQDLRNTLMEQAEAIHALKEELERLKQESPKTKPKPLPGKRKPLPQPSP